MRGNTARPKISHTANPRSSDKPSVRSSADTSSSTQGAAAVNAVPATNAATKLLPLTNATRQYARTGRTSTPRDRVLLVLSPRRRDQPRTRPPPAPTTTPSAAPTPRSNRPRTTLAPALSPSSPAAAAIANNTTGVTSPSLRPLSTFRVRRIRTGTTGLSTVAAPRPASVGANAAARNNATMTGIAGNATLAARNPNSTVNGRPTSSKRMINPRSASICLGRTCAASWNRINARVTSATTFTPARSEVVGGATSEISTPAATNAIGAV